MRRRSRTDTRSSKSLRRGRLLAHRDVRGPCGNAGGAPQRTGNGKRLSQCFSYFCKHECGEHARRLWSALHDVFDHVEDELTHSCALEPGIPTVAIKMLGKPGRRDRVVRLLEASVTEGAEVLIPQLLWGQWDL